jgi:succinate dehydrogenase membrane anchor subunit
MAFLTDRKRATGLGAGHTGTGHFWAMTKSSAALAVLMPLFVLTFGRILGAPYEEVVAYYHRPFPALVAGLTILVSFVHFKDGVQELILDYVHGRMARFLIALMAGVSWAAAATGIFAVLRIAL